MARTKRLRIGLTLAAVGALAIGGLVCFRPERATEPSRPPASRTGLEDLEAVLVELRSAWRPEDHERVLAAAAEHTDRYAVALRRLFNTPEHPLVVPGLELAGFLKLQEVLPLVLQLAERRELRLQAMTAADAIAPLSDADLAGLLDDPDPDMVLAALAMAGRHDQPPLHAVIGLLAHDDDRVAEAALASLPDRLAADFRAALEQIAKDERPKVATRGWQALLRIPDQTDAATAAITAQPPVTASPTPGDGDAGLPPAPPDTPADTPAAHAALIEQLDAVADETRIAALQGLYVLARPEDGERVLSLLQVANPDAVKKQACLFLGRVQHRPAVRTLIDLLRDSEDPGLKANAFWSLQRITALKLKPDAALWELWWDRAGKEFVTPSPR